MLDKLMQISLKNRLIVLLAALSFFITGAIITFQLPVDVFPDLTAPTVTLLTEAHGFAPEEVEMLVTFPLETAVNGASGVRRVRSTSIQGLSTIWVEFEWGTDIFKARQIVNEKIQGLQNALPVGVDQPILAPVTSIMGEIMLVGLTSDSTSAMDLRTIADFNLRRRILAVPGVAQVLVYGGETKQYQVQIDPWQLKNYHLSLDQILLAVARTNVNAAGGIFVQSGKEYLIRGLGRIENISQLENTVVTMRDGVPLLLGEVAKVKITAATKLGEASINNHRGIMLVISKQPDANTMELTGRIELVLAESKTTLPSDITLHTDIFKQSDFINLAIENVVAALRDGAILVIIILMLFLANARTVIISITAIPLSLIMTMLVLKMLDLTVNTMTLGGLAIAIGVLVDDAIIYVENVHRRLRQNAIKPTAEQRPFFDVVSDASAEIRTPIVMATFIIIVVFLPLFFLSGVEGRMLRPLGLAYVVSIFSSLLVAVTVTPALSSFLLRKTGMREEREPWIVRTLKNVYRPSLDWALQRSGFIIVMAVLLIFAVLATLPFLGRSFLPEFNEGTFNISMATVPGTSLEESDKIGQMVETILLSHPAVKSTARRTGRTELDEHSMGSHAHEMEVQIDLSQIKKKELLEELRTDLSIVPGTIIAIGQPISHRIDHMLSGTRANIAIKIFGPDLYKLRSLADQIETQMKDIEGIVDLSKDQQTDVPQVRLKVNRDNLTLFGLTAADVDEMIDIAFLGLPVSQVYDGQNRHDLVVRYAPQFRSDLDAVRNSLIDTPTGAQVPLKMVTDIQVDKGPNYISRENVQRKIVVQANVADRDLLSVVDDIKNKIGENVVLPQGYYVEYGGQFESAAEATRTITLLSILSILAIFVALYLEFGNFRQSFLVMVNLPLALIGGVIALFFSEGIITIASMVGFITLFGIAVRNGIIMVSHYNYLMEVEDKSLREAVVQGSSERLNPIMMTALTTGLALLPLALAMDQPGSEIQAPMSIVILGGLLTATLLNMIVIPVLFEKWGVRIKN
ncbi:MAG: AcrB/AcrD/AcrF family protein [Calditrichaeota bacterium]|nr:MAG: AcrB/AcrD/AcrF family protein [Calditrichota bacterium]